MIIMYKQTLVAFPDATQEGLLKLLSTMSEAVNIHNKMGRPNSGDLV